MAAKMANTIDDNKLLQEAYLPHQAAVVRLADAGPVRGRNSFARAEEWKGTQQPHRGSTRSRIAKN